MTFFVKAFGVHSETEPLVPLKLERRNILVDDVVIAIAYAGICHTDLHFADNKWNNSTYPMVPGHEIVGFVESVGREVTKHKVGDCVAVGCMIDSCRKCEQCKLSHEMFCVDGSDQAYNSPERRFPGHSTAGGYSEKIVVPEHFTLKVPLPLQQPALLSGVAPILCAGVTMYSPLRQYRVGHGTRVAVVGLGGLGHMGLKLAKALGAEVTVISRTHEKENEAKLLGADRVLATTCLDDVEGGKNCFDLVLDTIPGDHDLEPLISFVRPYGTLCVVGHVGTISRKIHSGSLVSGNKSIAGSFIAGIEETQELLDFCGAHEIISDHKIIPIEQANEAWTVLREGKVATRFVIDISRFRKPQ